MEEDNPTLTDYLIMRVAQRVQQQWLEAKDQAKVTLDDQRVHIQRKRTPLQTEGTSVRRTKPNVAASKSVWMAGVGLKRDGVKRG